MGWLTIFAYYFLFWWVTLFAVLSIGLRTQDDAGEVITGTHSSAPARPRVWRTLALNTVISALVFGAWYVATEVVGIGLSDLPSFYPQDR